MKVESLGPQLQYHFSGIPSLQIGVLQSMAIRLPSVLNAITFSVNRDVCVEHPIRIYVRIRHPDRIFCIVLVIECSGADGSFVYCRAIILFDDSHRRALPPGQ
jgi:hypothetical protein